MSVEDLKGQWITLIGTGSIQEYVFGTNRLKENAGASELVAQALDYWKGKGEIFVGGGNAALLFQDEPKLIAAIESWSREMLEKAPNLRLLAAHAQIGESFRDAYHDAKRILLDSENAPPFGAELGQLPVVRECASTGRAANIEGKNHSWLSVESLRKQEAGEISHRGLGEKYRNALDGQFQFPKEFANLGPMDGASQIAVVHIDGNRIGKLFQDLLDGNSHLDGVQLKDRLSLLSERVSELAQGAFAAIVGDVVAAVAGLREQGVTFATADGDEQPYLPLRPVVEAGDDLTFVCHGKLGLSLAVRYLRHFEALSARLLAPFVADGDPPRRTGAAGVLIMPGKFPFARGYEMAAELTALAKQARNKEALGPGELDASWLAFDLIMEGATGGPSGGEIYRLGGADDSRNWSRFDEIWRHFRSRDFPRNRAKRLFESLSRGNSELEFEYLKAAGIELPRNSIDRPEYLAPLEMLDLHLEWPNS